MNRKDLEQIQDFFKSVADWKPMRSRSYDSFFSSNPNVLEQVIVHAAFKNQKNQNTSIVTVAIEHDGSEVRVFISHSGQTVWEKVLDQKEIESLIPGGDFHNWFYFSEVIDSLISFTEPVANELLGSNGNASEWFDTAGLDYQELQDFEANFLQNIQDGKVVCFEEGYNNLTSILYALYE